MDFDNFLRQFAEFPRITLFIIVPALFVLANVIIQLASPFCGLMATNGCRVWKFQIGVLGVLVLGCVALTCGILAFLFGIVACKGTASAVGPAYIIVLLFFISREYWSIHEVLRQRKQRKSKKRISVHVISSLQLRPH